MSYHSVLVYIYEVTLSWLGIGHIFISQAKFASSCSIAGPAVQLTAIMEESKFWKAHTHPLSVTKKHLEFLKDFLQVNDELVTLPSRYNRELKQQQRRRLRKRHLKSEFVLPETLSR